MRAPLQNITSCSNIDAQLDVADGGGEMRLQPEVMGLRFWPVAFKILIFPTEDIDSKWSSEYKLHFVSIYPIQNRNQEKVTAKIKTHTKSRTRFFRRRSDRRRF